MKKFILLSCALALFLCGCTPKMDTPATVSVGAQSGALTEGTSGTVTFPLTTLGIADGTYSAAVTNRPTGVTVSGSVVINNNSGTLTLAGNTSTKAGVTSTLRLTINGVQSEQFTLTILPPSATKTVTVGAQSGTLTAGTAGSVTFPVTTANIANGEAGTIEWFSDAAGTTPTVFAPIGILLSVSNVASNAANVTAIDSGTTHTAGDRYFRVTIDGITSDVATLTVSGAASTKTVTVGAQEGTLTVGALGAATLPVTVTGITITVGAHTPAITNMPAGSWFNLLTMLDDGTLTLMLMGTPSAAGTFTNLTLTIDGITSAPFTVTVGAAAPTADGSAGNPFIVNNVATLKKVGSGTDGWGLDKHYRQTANIDLNGESWTGIGNSTTHFTGTYDGGGYSISNLSLSSTSPHQGMFRYIGVGGVVKNLALKGVSISGSNFTGGIAGISYGTIEHCYVTGTINGAMDTGGLAGENNGGVIKNSYSSCEVTSTSRGGGIAGRNSASGLIINCYATGKITGAGYIGGIVGWNAAKTEECVAVNSQVSATTGSAAQRVAGWNHTSDGGTLSNNWGRETGMILTNSSGNVTISSGHDRVDGRNVAATYTHEGGSGSGAWWNHTNYANFSSTAWTFDFNRLPHLLTTTGGAFSEAQNPTVQ